MRKRQRRRQRRPNLPAAGADIRAAKRASLRDAIPTDYAHIITDLKRIALLATLLTGVLVVLSFVIQ